MTRFVIFGMFFEMGFRDPMFQLTMTGEYAVRAMLHIAALPPDAIAPIADISRAWEVPETFLRKIVGKLARGGLLTTHRGNGGGIALSRPSREITLLDVLRVTEGPLALNACLTSAGACHRTPWCPVHPVWCEAQEKLREVLSSRTLEDLAQHVPSGSRPAGRQAGGLTADYYSI
jgi:Rrf2 family protein